MQNKEKDRFIKLMSGSAFTLAIADAIFLIVFFRGGIVNYDISVIDMNEMIASFNGIYSSIATTLDGQKIAGFNLALERLSDAKVGSLFAKLTCEDGTTISHALEKTTDALSNKFIDTATALMERMKCTTLDIDTANSALEAQQVALTVSGAMLAILLTIIALLALYKTTLKAEAQTAL